MDTDTANPFAPPRSDIPGALASGPPLAERGARFLARFLDGLVEIGPVLVGMVVAVVLSEEQRPAFAPMVVGYLIAFGLWTFQVIRLVQTGQTLGKKWAGVKVVRLDGGPVSFGSHFLRGLVFGIIGFISIIFIFRQDRRCLHDLAGETKVVAI
jgi:uncharacterized RDD family membrane protein YckC